MKEFCAFGISLSLMLALGCSGNELSRHVIVDVSSPPASTEGSLDAVILPDRAVWEEYETITGKVRFRNTGDKVLSIHPTSLERVQVTKQDLSEPEHIQVREFICGTARFDRPNVIIRSGATYDHPFEVLTDPMNKYGGKRLYPEHYCLTFPSDESSEITLSVKIAPIEVRSNPSLPKEGRIVQFTCAGDRLLLVRERGLVESCDLTSQKQRAQVIIPSFGVDMRGPFVVFSPDGSLVAVVRNDGTVAFCDLEPPEPTWKVVDIAKGSSAKSSYWRPYYFDSRSQYLYVACEPGLVEVGTPPRETVRLIAGPSRLISPRGNYLAWRGEASENGRIYVAPTCALTDAFTMKVPSSSWGTRLFMGLHGVYASQYGSPPVLYSTYDGMSKRVMRAHGELAAESLDGKFAVFIPTDIFGSRLAGTASEFEVWDVASARRLCKVGDKRYRGVSFASDSERLVCALVAPSDSTFHWFDGSFEIRDARSGKVLQTFRR